MTRRKFHEIARTEPDFFFLPSNEIEKKLVVKAFSVLFLATDCELIARVSISWRDLRRSLERGVAVVVVVVAVTFCIKEFRVRFNFWKIYQSLDYACFSILLSLLNFFFSCISHFEFDDNKRRRWELQTSPFVCIALSRMLFLRFFFKFFFFSFSYFLLFKGVVFIGFTRELIDPMPKIFLIIFSFRTDCYLLKFCSLSAPCIWECFRSTSWRFHSRKPKSLRPPGLWDGNRETRAPFLPRNRSRHQRERRSFPCPSDWWVRPREGDEDTAKLSKRTQRDNAVRRWVVELDKSKNRKQIQFIASKYENK